MTEQLVYILPVQKRPGRATYYGQVGADSGPICRIEPNGMVYLFETASIMDVQAVLAEFPYYVEFEELKDVRVR